MLTRSLSLILVLMLAGVAGGADTHYCSASAGGSGAGTIGDPWDWTDATTVGNVAAGDLVYCKGAFGDSMHIHSTNAHGTVGNHITYQVWPGETASGTQTVLGSTSGDTVFYVTLRGFTFSPGGSLTGTPKPAVKFYTCSDVVIDDCNIIGQYNSNITAEMSDYYPQYWVNDSAITYSSPYNPSNITISNCTIHDAFRFITAGHSSNWLIENNTMYGVAEFGICITDPRGGSSIVGNVITDINPRRYVFYWPGTATGDWTGHEYEPCTQDGSGAKGLFYKTQTGTYNWLCYPCSLTPEIDDNVNGIWRLDDANFAGVYFTPSGNGDQVHANPVYIAANSTGDYTFTVTGNRIIMDEDGTACIISLDHTSPTTINLVNNILVSTYLNALCINTQGGAQTLNIYNCFLNKTLNNSAISVGVNATFNIYNTILSGIGSYTGTVNGDYNCWVGESNGSDVHQGEANSLYSQDYANTPSGNNRYFIDYAGENYKVYNTSSPQYNTASAVYAPAYDYVGVTRPIAGVDDIGPYEYPSEPNATNNDPVLDAIGTQSVFEGRLLTFDVNATDEDGDPLTYSCVDEPTGATFVSPTFSWRPTYDQSGTCSVTFRVTDGESWDEANVMITVINQDFAEGHFRRFGHNNRRFDYGAFQRP